MKLYQKILFKHTDIRLFLYALWYITVTFLAINIYQAGLDTNTQGGRCMLDDWQVGMIYQWVWDNQPCVFTGDFLIGYLFYFTLYLIFNYIRQLILGGNISIGWRCIEVCIWFILNWGYLLWLTQTEYGTLNLVMIRTSLLGTLLFFAPFFVLAVGIGLRQTKTDVNS